MQKPAPETARHDATDNEPTRTDPLRALGADLRDLPDLAQPPDGDDLWIATKPRRWRQLTVWLQVITSVAWMALALALLALTEHHFAIVASHKDTC